MNINLTIVGQIISFLIFLMFCMKYVWKPILHNIESRQKKIANDLLLAEKAKEDFNTAKMQADEEIKKAKLKAKKIIDQANKNRFIIINKAQKESELERDKILLKTKLDIDIAIKNAFDDLYQQIAKLAISGAEKIIEHNLNKKINHDIVNKIISKF